MNNGFSSYGSSVSIPDYIHKPKLQNPSRDQQIPHQIMDLFGNRSTSTSHAIQMIPEELIIATFIIFLIVIIFIFYYSKKKK